MESEAAPVMVNKTLESLLAASPLTVALLAVVLFLLLFIFLAYKLVPYLMVKQEESRIERHERTPELWARYDRVEGVARRVHEFANAVPVWAAKMDGWVMRADELKSRVLVLEAQVEKMKNDSGEHRRQVAELIGTANETKVRVEGLQEQLARGESRQDNRMDTLQATLDRLADKLLGPINGGNNGRQS